MTVEPWIRSVDEAAHGRLFCLPYAGGGTAEYRTWRDGLPGHVDLCPIVLPGREARLKEPPIDAMEGLVDALLDALAPLMRRAPYAIYGHSMGAWIGFEVARGARRRRLPLPSHLFVGARRAPDILDSRPRLAGLPDDEFLAAVQERYGAIPGAILANRQILDLFLPALRADFRLLDGYRYAEEPPLAVPITAVRGRDDAMVSSTDVRAWQAHTSASFDMQAIFGGHFFLRDAGEDVADLVGGVLATALR